MVEYELESISEDQEIAQCPACGTIIIPCESESGQPYIVYLPLAATGFCAICDPTETSPTIH